MSEPRSRVVVVGGGAAGFFGAIRCASLDPTAEVTVYEASAQPLAKVRISGGGRCNVTHACFDPHEFVRHYPRGARELLGPLHHFGARETVAWFAACGVELKTEPDGRMFPITDDSATIVTCLQQAAARAGVRIVTRCGVRSVARRASAGFDVTLTSGEMLQADRMLLASGGNPASAGFAIAQSLGHLIEHLVPSLFTLHIDDARLRGLAGLSVPMAEVCAAGTRLEAAGPLLITHWGLSGPAILRLSAWGARELHAMGYRATLSVNWVAPRTPAEVAAALEAMRVEHPRRRVLSMSAFGVPARLWERLVTAADVGDATVWASLSRVAAQSLVSQLTACELVVTGKSPNKEEFVTCGGVRLREVDFRTMESRLCPGLFFAGEVLDLDGLTGGFNFQAAWTTGWLAGTAMSSGLASAR